MSSTFERTYLHGVPQVRARSAGPRPLHVLERSNFVYFQRILERTSADTAIDSRFELRGKRMTPWVGASLSPSPAVRYESICESGE